MIRPFLFLLAVMGMTIVAAAPALGSLILIHRHTLRPAAFWIWVVGVVVYAAAAATVVGTILDRSGLIRWVEQS